MERGVRGDLAQELKTAGGGRAKLLHTLRLKEAMREDPHREDGEMVGLVTSSDLLQARGPGRGDS